LTGEDFPLGHGYYVTKQPSQQELDEGITYQEARIREENFFKHTAPWSTEFAEFSPRFGTQALQAKLSNTLTRMILTGVPNISKRIAVRLCDIREDLEAYPEPPREPIGIVNDLHRKLCTAIQKCTDHSNDAFMTDWKAASQEFEKAIRKKFMPSIASTGKLDGPNAKPSLPTNPSPSIPAKRSSGKNASEAIALSSGEEDSLETPPKKRRQTALFVTPTPTKRSNPVIKSSRRDSFPRPKKFTLDEIRAQISDIRDPDRRFSDHANPKIFESIAMSCVKNWIVPTQELQNRIHEALVSGLEGILYDELLGYHDTEFYRQMESALNQFITELMQEQDDKNRDPLFMENREPMTRSEDLMQLFKDRELLSLRQMRFDARAEKVFEAEEQETDREIPTDKKEKRKKDDKFKTQLGPDPYKAEIDLFAQARAYYMLASNRFMYVYLLSPRIRPA
jgi:hypothetical protein